MNCALPPQVQAWYSELNDLRAAASNKLVQFGGQAALQLQAAIKAKRWDQEPVGPVGYYLGLRDPK